MLNATMKKFGYPRTLLKDYQHWSAQLRPHQATLGALVLVAKEEARAFPDLPTAAFAELALVVRDAEAALRGFCPYDKINYLMLMMVDPDVHFHVLPRYAKAQNFAGVDFVDAGWPSAPILAGGIAPAPEVLDAIVAALTATWPSTNP